MRHWHNATRGREANQRRVSIPLLGDNGAFAVQGHEVDVGRRIDARARRLFEHAVWLRSLLTASRLRFNARGGQQQRCLTQPERLEP